MYWLTQTRYHRFQFVDVDAATAISIEHLKDVLQLR